MSTGRVAVAVTLSLKTTYTADEELAFRHIRRYLGGYDKYVIIPEDHPARYPGFEEKRFPRKYFGTGLAHTMLLLSEEFWTAFSEYEFVLIHHLDALCFSDELMEWCEAGYDYIGAPWLISPDTPHITEAKVGNGGFSLRRVDSALRVLRSQRPCIPPDEYWQRFCAQTPSRWRRVLNYPRKYLKRIPYFNNAQRHIRWVLKDDVHEDRFWAEYATRYDPGFRIAPVEVAMRFAFEAAPRQCMERIGGRMAFGAHRWTKFDRKLFEPHLLHDGPGSEVCLSHGAAMPGRVPVDPLRTERPLHTPGAMQR